MGLWRVWMELMWKKGRDEDKDNGGYYPWPPVVPDKLVFGPQFIQVITFPPSLESEQPTSSTQWKNTAVHHLEKQGHRLGLQAALMWDLRLMISATKHYWVITYLPRTMISYRLGFSLLLTFSQLGEYAKSYWPRVRSSPFNAFVEVVQRLSPSSPSPWCFANLCLWTFRWDYHNYHHIHWNWFKICNRSSCLVFFSLPPWVVVGICIGTMHKSFWS